MGLSNRDTLRDIPVEGMDKAYLASREAYEKIKATNDKIEYSSIRTKIQGRIDMLWAEVDGFNTAEQDKYAALRVQSELQDLLISIQQSLLEDNGII